MVLIVFWTKIFGVISNSYFTSSLLLYNAWCIEYKIYNEVTAVTCVDFVFVHYLLRHFVGDQSRIRCSTRDAGYALAIAFIIRSALHYLLGDELLEVSVEPFPRYAHSDGSNTLLLSARACCNFV